MLVLSYRHRLIGGNSVVWLCDNERIKSFQNGPPSAKAKLRRWLTQLSPLRLKVYHIQSITKENADSISHNNFDALIRASSEAFAPKAFAQIDLYLDPNI